MKRIKGISASGGIAIGRLILLEKKEEGGTKKTISDSGKELVRLKLAKEKAVEALNGIYRDSLRRVGEKNSMIFQIHLMMLEDDDFYNAILNVISTEKVNAEYAIRKVGQEFSERFANMEDEYMRARKTDVLDIADQLIRCLGENQGEQAACPGSPSIVAVPDLMPSETMRMDQSNVLAIVTRDGSKTSHSAILSRSLGIPSVVGLGSEFQTLTDGAFTIVDGSSGEVLVDPEEEIRKQYQVKRDNFLRYRQDLLELADKKARTKDGREIEIYANIGSPTDLDAVLKNGADGIGLFRSEFLYMRSNSMPSEETQLKAYKTVLRGMGQKRVIVRTLDLGADKRVPYLNLPDEENPALGYRAIRICLDRKELFYTQLRALMRASIFGNLSIMFPMVISLDEVRKAREILNQVKKNLEAEKIKFSPDVKVGIMVETPAAVMLSEELAKEVDFFSIGTNDLTQYTLAVDRLNSAISKLYDPSHPAVLKMIEKTVENAKKAGIKVGICGESASDKKLTKFYLQIGVDELSVVPSRVLELKKTVREL